MSAPRKKTILIPIVLAALFFLGACGKTSVPELKTNPLDQARRDLFQEVGLDEKGTIKKGAGARPLPTVSPTPPALPATDEYPIK